MEKGTPGGTGAGHGGEGPGVMSWAQWRRPRCQKLELGTVEKALGSGAGAGHGEGPGVGSWARWRRPRGQELEVGVLPQGICWT